MAEDKVVVDLAYPVSAHGREISQITLRRPKGSDYVVCGYPLIMVAPGETPQDDDGNLIDNVPLDITAEYRPNASAIAKLIARCGDVPSSTVKALDGSDFNDCLMAILGFLGDGGQAKKSSRPASISPESGDNTLATS